MPELLQNAHEVLSVPNLKKLSCTQNKIWIGEVKHVIYLFVVTKSSLLKSKYLSSLFFLDSSLFYTGSVYPA
jgi:hypothetical protein